MKLETFNDIEKSMGGRPKSLNPKIRLSFYLSQEETIQLKGYTVGNDLTISELIRNLVRSLIKNNDKK